jgi:acetyltransferase-like isoleucine patch superfamily enzyme
MSNEVFNQTEASGKRGGATAPCMDHEDRAAARSTTPAPSRGGRVVAKIFYRFWNLIQRTSFAELALTAKVHPFSGIKGRARVAIGESSRLGAFCRVEAIEPRSFIRIGARCDIHPSAMLLAYGGHIEIGDDCSVNPFCVLYGHGGLKIGNGVRIAAGTAMIPANHNFDEIDRPIFQQGVSAKGIIIEDDVWIAANATILDGVRIGRGCVIAAGAVVTKDVEPFSVMGGVPARLIQMRKAAPRCQPVATMPSPRPSDGSHF